MAIPIKDDEQPISVWIPANGGGDIVIDGFDFLTGESVGIVIPAECRNALADVVRMG